MHRFSRSGLRRPSVPRPRRGGLLVECCAAIVLLAGASAVLLRVSATTATLVYEARLRDLVQQETARLLGGGHRDPCANAMAEPAESLRLGPRLRFEVTATEAAGLHTVTVDVYWRGSALSGAFWRHHRSSSAVWCAE